MKGLNAAIMGVMVLLWQAAPVRGETTQDAASPPTPAAMPQPSSGQADSPSVPWPHPDPQPELPKGLALSPLEPEPTAPEAIVMPKAPTRHVSSKVAQGVLGQEVHDTDGKSIGRMADVIVDAKGVPVAALIDVGGFLGVGDRRIAIEWKQLAFAPDNPQRSIVLKMTTDELKSAPEYKDGEGGAVLTPSETVPPAAQKDHPDGPGDSSAPDQNGRSSDQSGQPPPASSASPPASSSAPPAAGDAAGHP
ncbi:Hypothetical protein GbCGDNIH9_2146 [Granulibacter bethesdensis]|uniref:PRC-barrel domain-containing protein n=1 Tax=Granulibacter bethesdensis TaxID=364410 RepID=A0AAC9KFS1_9PROT|nr:PRC-barrel domain-containing protein [Granulibacter bethesdensis]APH55470.1 Hypothetical protein GbCGDNIH9_2146 [Granulibacter bethesdensis]APH63056.1 Hypothetical protein GbCGDNIH8_2146 [Granulibacter bethesdensis]